MGFGGGGTGKGGLFGQAGPPKMAVASRQMMV